MRMADIVVISATISLGGRKIQLPGNPGENRDKVGVRFGEYCECQNYTSLELGVGGRGMIRDWLGTGQGGWMD